MFYVYCLFRPWNGEPCYVGKGSGKRVQQHFSDGPRHHNQHLAAILKKAGGSLPYVIIHEGLDESTAFAYEKILIKSIGRTATGGPLVNHTDGGEGVSGLRFNHKPETIEYLRTKAIERGPEQASRMKGNTLTLGHRLSDEHKAKIDPTGRRHKQDTLVKMSKSAEMRWDDPKQRPAMEEHCREIAHLGAEAIKQRWNDPAFRSEQVKKRTGQKRSPETCENIRQARLLTGMINRCIRTCQSFCF